MTAGIEQKQLTLNQFKSWLDGVEEMQGTEWTPNPEQWRKIRSKITLLLEEAESIESIIARTVAALPRAGESATYSPAPPITTRQFIPPDVPGGPVPLHDSNIDMGGAPRLTTMMPAGSGKTPNIDTSNGAYTSAFV